MNLHVYRCPHCPASVSISAEGFGGRGPRCMAHTPPVWMDLLPDTAKAVLPLDQEPAHLVTPGMVPLKVKHLQAAGILLPETQDALEWLYRHRATNGMAEAFLKVGGRRCIDLVAFARLMRERRA